MDDVVNRFAKELADAIAAAVAENPQVEACRARAREAGVSLGVAGASGVVFSGSGDRASGTWPFAARRFSFPCHVGTGREGLSDPPVANATG